MHPAQEPLSRPAKLGVSIVMGLVTLFTLFVVFLAVFYIAGRLRYQEYESIVKSLVVAGTFGFSMFLFCFFDLITATRFLTGTDRARFVSLICWLSIALPIDATLESLFVPQLFHPADGTWFLRWPSEFVVAGLLGIAAAISKKRWGWAIWGIVALLWGILWVRAIFVE